MGRREGERDWGFSNERTWGGCEGKKDKEKRKEEVGRGNLKEGDGKECKKTNVG